MKYFPYIVSVWLFLVGLYGIASSRHLVHMIICLAVVQSSTYIMLLAAGFRTGSAAPIFFDQPVGTPAVDPVVHALVLTDIVVGATVMALLLAMTLQIHKRKKSVDPEEFRPLREKK